MAYPSGYPQRKFLEISTLNHTTTVHILVEEAQEHTRDVLATGLLVVHDTSRGGEDNVTELTRGKELDSPVLEVTELNGVAGVDNTALVQAVFRDRKCQNHSCMGTIIRCWVIRTVR